MPDSVAIRPLTSAEDFHACEELQRVIWPGSELEIAPLHILKTVAVNGGLVLGAFADGRMIGFVFGFLGTDDASPDRPALARLKHCSHMAGVLPAYRDRQVGYQLKLAQREHVLRQGVRLITWTYDPLESRNARLNIARLGAVCRTYLRDVYGAMPDALNAGLPSDRFQVEWWVTSARVKERLFGERGPLALTHFTEAGAPILNPTTVNKAGLPQPSDQPPPPAGFTALLEIPANFQAIKSADMDLARAWRRHTRDLFEAAFAAGFLVTDFFHETFPDRPRSFYALSQGDARLEMNEN